MRSIRRFGALSIFVVTLVALAVWSLREPEGELAGRAPSVTSPAPERAPAPPVESSRAEDSVSAAQPPSGQEEAMALEKTFGIWDSLDGSSARSLEEQLAATTWTPVAPTDDPTGVAPELLRLRALFGDGSKKGWQALRDLTALRQLISDADGLAKFLDLVDGEKNTEFVEAVLHHLPLAVGEHQQDVIRDEELHDELWTRFESDDDPARRRAFLRFFAYQPRLSEAKLDQFIEILADDPESSVRAQALDALNSAGAPERSWSTLCDAAEGDTDESIRASAIEGLGKAKSDRAASIVEAAFVSESEALRAAAWRSDAGASPPRLVTGGDAAGYLAKELLSAQTRPYREALIDRLIDAAPERLKQEVTRALPGEKDRWKRQDLQRALERAEKRIAERAAKDASR